MKRDLDLILSILSLTENMPAGGRPLMDFSALNVDQHTAVEHIWLAKDAGLLDAYFPDDDASHGVAAIVRLTSSGHDFLDQAREPTRWNEAKRIAAKAGGGATVEVLKTALSHLTTVALTAVLASHKP